jgi:hypothetical protein
MSLPGDDLPNDDRIRIIPVDYPPGVTRRETHVARHRPAVSFSSWSAMDHATGSSSNADHKKRPRRLLATTRMKPPPPRRLALEVL